MNKIAEKIVNRIKKDKKLLFIVILGIIGMLLLLLSGMTSGSKDSVQSETVQVHQREQEIEKELEALLKSVNGAGKVKAMVTLDSLDEHIVAVNSDSKASEDTHEYSEQYVLREEAGDTDGLVLKIITPVVRGVGITCEGADSSIVKQEIIRLVSAALGIPVNRIWVTKMQE